MLNKTDPEGNVLRLTLVFETTEKIEMIHQIYIHSENTLVVHSVLGVNGSYEQTGGSS